MILDIIGVIATLSSIASLPPQLYQTYKIKSANDVSMLMLINFLICSVSWVLYGVMTQAVFVYVTNVIMTIFTIWMIGLKLYYTKE